MSKTRQEEAALRTAELKNLEGDQRQFWWKQGEHIWHVHEKQLWKELEAKSYKAWLEATLPISRQTANDAMKCWRELNKLDGYHEIPKENAKILVKEVVASKRKRYLKAAKTMPTRQFRAFVAGGKVGAARAEETVQKHFIFTHPQWAVIQSAIDYMLVQDGKMEPEEALEHIAIEFMQEPARHAWLESESQHAQPAAVEEQ